MRIVCTRSEVESFPRPFQSAPAHATQDVIADEYARDNRDLAPQIRRLEDQVRQARNRLAEASAQRGTRPTGDDNVWQLM